jgi:hypothetical protein
VLDVRGRRVTRGREKSAIGTHPDDVEIEGTETKIVDEFVFPVAYIAQHIGFASAVDVQVDDVHCPAPFLVVFQKVVQATLHRLQARKNVQDPQRLRAARETIRRVHVEVGVVVGSVARDAIAQDLLVR